MSRTLSFAAAVAVLSLPFPATAARAQIVYGVSAGAVAPLSTFGTDVDMGYHASASVSYLPPLAPLGFRVEGMFSEFNWKESVAPGGKSRIVSASGNAVFTVPGMMGAYLTGGVGMYRYRLSPSTPNSNKNDPGLNIGGGFRLPLAGFSAYGEVRYHYVGGGNGNYQMVPITFGVMF